MNDKYIPRDVAEIIMDKIHESAISQGNTNSIPTQSVFDIINQHTADEPAVSKNQKWNKEAKNLIEKILDDSGMFTERESLSLAHDIVEELGVSPEMLMLAREAKRIVTSLFHKSMNYDRALKAGVVCYGLSKFTNKKARKESISYIIACCLQIARNDGLLKEDE